MSIDQTIDQLSLVETDFVFMLNEKNRCLGIVLWFDNEKGHGLLRGPQLSDVSISSKDIVPISQANLTAGDHVRYMPEYRGESGWVARDVIPILPEII